MAVCLQESRPGGNAPLPFMGRTIAKGRFRFRFNAFAYVDKLSVHILGENTCRPQEKAAAVRRGGRRRGERVEGTEEPAARKDQRRTRHERGGDLRLRLFHTADAISFHHVRLSA